MLDMSRLTRLELQILLAAFTRNEFREIRQLVNIIPILRVEERKYTGIGFYSKILEYDSPRIDAKFDQILKKEPPEAIGFHTQIDGIVNFIVWLKEGKIDCIEAASTEGWPDVESEFVITGFPE